MTKRLNVRAYCAAVFVAGCAIVGLVDGATNLGYIEHHALDFAVLSAGVMLGEMLPVKILRRGNDEQITLSTPFSIALLLAGGLAPALIAQGVASAVQDLVSGKPWWRIRFNVGQYTISMVAALTVMRLFSAAPRIGSAHPFSSAALPGMLLGAAVFFLVNTGVVGIAVALYQGMPIRRYFANDIAFVVITGVVMLVLAPIVIAAAAYSVVLVPLCLAPVVAIYTAMWQGARSDHAARHDSLTGLPNRAAFHDAVLNAIADQRRECCVLLVDLDRFKDVNDTLGHRYGDLLLRQVAERFRTEVRRDDQIARLGGDEFAFFSCGPPEQSIRLAQRIADSLRAPFELEQMVVDVQASVGIALFPTHGTDVETLLQKADVAMYQGKDSRADVTVYDERHDHHSPEKLALTGELRTSVEGDGIAVWYQPELDLGTERIVAVEALVRWDHPHLGLLAPAAFVHMAERTNLINPLTERVMEIALRQVAQWRGFGIDVSVAVNISAQVLVHRAFTERVITALATAGVPAGRLKLEVTESTLIADPPTARAVLLELAGLGVEISIDDFGTGYSSLASLVDLPVSEVKIDRSFVSRMADGSNEKIIVTSTIDLAHHLGLRAVAEGVDDLNRLPELQALGCDVAQGFVISEPLPGPEMTGWLLEFQSRPAGEPDDPRETDDQATPATPAVPQVA